VNKKIKSIVHIKTIKEPHQKIYNLAILNSSINEIPNDCALNIYKSSINEMK
jgi:hypothetical protein